MTMTYWMQRPLRVVGVIGGPFGKPDWFCGLCLHEPQSRAVPALWQ